MHTIVSNMKHNLAFHWTVIVLALRACLWTSALPQR